MNASDIEAQIRELSSNIAKLCESNIQLLQALESGPDTDFEQAIEENKVAIARRVQLIEELKMGVKVEGHYL
ncbi:hypothetical protein BC829DRAFT_390890 [Chytridium lagenaria]|nr:hypothetical protein BC829DRAFT_390890 [Chytridium lagenaria]